MARKLTVFPENRGRQEKYPYDEWFDNMPLELVSGEDFESDVQVESLRLSLFYAARKRGIELRTAKTEDGLAIDFRP